VELPNLLTLNKIFLSAQSKKSKIQGYACHTSDSFSGVGAFCFCDNIEEWMALYPSIIFIEALIEQDFEIYDAEVLEDLKTIYFKYLNVSWSNEDFASFRNELSNCVCSFDIDFSGRIHQLFELDTEDEFIERLLKQFKEYPKDNESNFLNFLDRY
jgi:hypothetical protein